MPGPSIRMRKKIEYPPGVMPPGGLMVTFVVFNYHELLHYKENPSMYWIE